MKKKIEFSLAIPETERLVVMPELTQQELKDVIVNSTKINKVKWPRSTKKEIGHYLICKIIFKMGIQKWWHKFD